MPARKTDPRVVPDHRPPTMNQKQQGTLEDIFADPVRANIAWRDIESLLEALGAEIAEARGSRVVGHPERNPDRLPSPDPQKETRRGAVRGGEGFLRGSQGDAMNTMTYKGYTAVVELDQEDGILFGKVMGLRDVITFEAETVPQAIEEFHTSVDSYLELCESRGEAPEKPYSGNFLVRIGPELHRELARYAAQRDASINSVVTDAVGKLVQGSAGRPPRPVADQATPIATHGSPGEVETGRGKRTRARPASPTGIMGPRVRVKLCPGWP